MINPHHKYSTYNRDEIRIRIGVIDKENNNDEIEIEIKIEIKISTISIEQKVITRRSSTQKDKINPTINNKVSVNKKEVKQNIIVR